MMHLFKKLLRDILAAKGQYIAITLVITLGVAFYVGLASASVGVEKNINEFYQSQHMADLWAVGNFDASSLSDVRAIANVENADIRAVTSAEMGESEFVVHTIPENPSVNIPVIERGAMPQSKTDCMVDRGYADANGVQIGDTLTVMINSMSYTLTISGIDNSPEYLYLAKSVGEINHDTYGALLVREDLLNAPINEIILTAKPGADLAKLKADLAEKLPGFGYALERKQNMSWMMLNDDIDQFGKVGAVFPIIFFLVAAVIIFISMSKNVETQRGQIGNMKALGIRRSVISFHFLSYTLFICLIGSVLGTLAGIFAVMPFIQSIFTTFYTMPVIHPAGFIQNTLIASGLAFAFGTFATIVSVRKPLRESPASAMRPKIPRKVKPLFLERFEKLWSKLSFGRKIILRNLFMNKGRAILSSIGIMGCVGLLIAALGFMDSIDLVLYDKFDDMSQYDVMVMLKTPVLSKEHLRLDIDGSVYLSSSVPASFTASGEAISTDLISLDADCAAVALYDESGNRVYPPKDGVLVPKLYAEKHGFAVGDAIPLTLTPVVGDIRTINVKISGVVMEYIGQDIYTSSEYLQTLGEAIPESIVYIVTDKNADEVATALRNNPAVKQAMTQADVKNKMEQSMNILRSMVYILIAASAVLALTVVYNISAINIFERRRDIATLKVLGYRRKEVNKLVFSENLMITGFGAFFGIFAGIGMLWLIITAVVSDEMMVPITLHLLSVVLAILLGFVFTVGANQLLRGKIKRIDMVESLKSVE